MVLRSWVSMDTSSFTVGSPLSADLRPNRAPSLPQPLPPGERGRMPYNREMPLYRGWAPGLISVAVTVYYTLSAGCLIVVGGLVDRHGPRGVLTYGVVTMAAAV